MTMRLSRFIVMVVWLLAAPAMALAANEAQSERRVALVIGNNDYQFAKKLDNAVADAAAFRKELESRGFQVVYRENANRRTMNSAMEEFMGKLSTDSVGLIFYSGHGVQINGANYLVPTDLSAKVPADFVYDAVDLSKLIERVSQTQAKFSLAVIDACRDNPFQGNGRDIGGTRGLVAPAGNATGVMIVYSAGANQKALDRLGDNDRDPNGLFTREFLKAIRMPGLTVQEAVNQIKSSVIAQAKSVGHVQTPAIYDQSVGTFVFTAGAARAPVQATVASVEQKTVQQVIQTVDPAAIELSFWDSIKSSTNPADFKAYLEQYPTGRFAALARNRLQPPVVAQPAVTQPVQQPVQQSQPVQAVAARSLSACPRNEASYNWSNCNGTVDMGGGEKYEGDMKAGLFDGRGTYTYVSGATYVGEWKNGGRHGQGVLVAKKGDKYDPQANFNKPWSRNTPFAMLVNMAESDRYEGEWKDNRRHGQGVYQFSNGDRYIGEFREDRFEGQAKFFYANGATPVSGTWANNKFVAAAAQPATSPDGVVQLGNTTWNGRISMKVKVGAEEVKFVGQVKFMPGGEFKIMGGQVSNAQGETHSLEDPRERELPIAWGWRQQGSKVWIGQYANKQGDLDQANVLTATLSGANLVVDLDGARLDVFKDGPFYGAGIKGTFVKAK